MKERSASWDALALLLEDVIDGKLKVMLGEVQGVLGKHWSALC
jgi:hypothetical protein